MRNVFMQHASPVSCRFHRPLQATNCTSSDSLILTRKYCILMSAKANYVALSSTKHMELVCLLHDFKMYSLTKELMRFPLKKANFMPTILPSAVRHFHLIPEHVVSLLKEKMNIK